MAHAPPRRRRFSSAQSRRFTEHLRTIGHQTAVARLAEQVAAAIMLPEWVREGE
jgi:hypothetical protein